MGSDCVQTSMGELDISEKIDSQPLTNTGALVMLPDAEVEPVFPLAEGAIPSQIQPEVYFIEEVLKFNPNKGYFVHWKGFPKKSRTWQSVADMPPELEAQMERVRLAYMERNKSGVVDSEGPPFYKDVIAKRGPRVPAAPDTSASEATYIINEVLAYVPNKGYLVSWVGYTDKNNSWQVSSDMPEELNEEMRRVREAYWTQQSRSEDPAIATTLVRRRAPLKKFRRAEVRRVADSDCEEVYNNAPVAVDLTNREISSIVAFDPKRGFLVRWKNQPDRFNSWRSEEHIPAEFRAKLNTVRDRYYVVVSEKDEDEEVKETTKRPISEDSATDTSPIHTKQARTVAVQAESARLVHSVLEFDPARGFLVHYKGLSSRENRWIPEADVPSGFRYELLLARERYEDDNLKKPAHTKTVQSVPVSQSGTVSLVTPMPSPHVQRTEPEEYEIEQILSYNPNRGYLVKWIGFTETTWQRTKDMPDSFAKEMKKVMAEYKKAV